MSRLRGSIKDIGVILANDRPRFNPLHAIWSLNSAGGSFESEPLSTAEHCWVMPKIKIKKSVSNAKWT